LCHYYHHQSFVLRSAPRCSALDKTHPPPDFSQLFHFKLTLFVLALRRGSFVGSCRHEKIIHIRNNGSDSVATLQLWPIPLQIAAFVALLSANE
jgi:hypothetical protein